MRSDPKTSKPACYSSYCNWPICNCKGAKTTLERALDKIALTFASQEPRYDDIPETLTRGECRALYDEIDRLRAALKLSPVT